MPVKELYDSVGKERWSGATDLLWCKNHLLSESTEYSFQLLFHLSQGKRLTTASDIFFVFVAYSLTPTTPESHSTPFIFHRTYTYISTGTRMGNTNAAEVRVVPRAADPTSTPVAPTVTTFVHATDRLPNGSVCGYTKEGVPAFSNADGDWSATKHYDRQLYMGLKWQCVEFVRRWLWLRFGLLLPQVNCAFSYAGLKRVWEPVARGRDMEDARHRVTGGVHARHAVLNTAKDIKKDVKWVEYPCTFVSQGSRTPPVGDSLIIYPMSWGSLVGHIGVITEVDLEKGLVYVADQNRFFQHWGDCHYSSVFRLECVAGMYYIRDHDTECSGWITFEA